MFLILIALLIVLIVTTLCFMNSLDSSRRLHNAFGGFLISGVFMTFLTFLALVAFSADRIGYTPSSTIHDLEMVNERYAHIVDGKYLVRIDGELRTIHEDHVTLVTDDAAEIEITKYTGNNWTIGPSSNEYILRIPTGQIEINE